MKKRILAMLLAAVMVMAMAPAVFAADGEYGPFSYHYQSVRMYRDEEGHPLNLSRKDATIDFTAAYQVREKVPFYTDEYSDTLYYDYDEEHWVAGSGSYETLLYVTVIGPGCTITVNDEHWGVDGILFADGGSEEIDYSSYSYTVEQTRSYTYTPDGFVLDEAPIITPGFTGQDFLDLLMSPEAAGKLFTLPLYDGIATGLAYFYVAEDAEGSGGTFTDVPADAYYADAVAWAVENNITSGTSATTFSPDVTCTRSQAVTFLWRAAGSPEPASTANPFVDVSSGQYYYKAVLWAVEKGITSGTSSTTFSPDQTCSRSQIVTLQWRAAGEPSASGSNFSDVPGSAFYAEAVAWAVENGITSGTGNGTFSPDSPCTRAQIVTFLYRDMAE